MNRSPFDILVRLIPDTKAFMDNMRAAQHATYDSVRAIKALNITAGGDLNKALSQTIRSVLSTVSGVGRQIASEALESIAFEENNQMALAALAEYRMKQEAVVTERVQTGTKLLTVEQQLAALEKQRAGIAAQNEPNLAQLDLLEKIRDWTSDIGHLQREIALNQGKLTNESLKLTEAQRFSAEKAITEARERIDDLQRTEIPKAQAKLKKLGWNDMQANENQIDFDAMAAQIMAGGDKVVGIFADQTKELTQDQIIEIKKKADEESKQMMDVLATMAIKSPFSRKEIVESYGTLIRMGGLSFEEGEKLMQQIVDIQAVTGKGNRGIQAMSLAVGKVLATGRLNGDAVNQLVKTAGIPVWEILAKSTGKTTQELQKMMRANKLSAEIVMPALEEYMTAFAGKAAEEAGTFVGLVNSISDLKDRVYSDFFKPIGDSLKRPFSDLVDFLTTGTFRESIRNAGQFIGEEIGKAIDFIYKSVDKFKKLGSDDGNPFTRFIVILKDLSKEFNVDVTPLIALTKQIEGIVVWGIQNKAAILEFANVVKNFVTGLILAATLQSVVGKIFMFITGFLASPIVLLTAAMVGMYLAWENNFGGIRDWVNANSDSIKTFLVTLYDEISKIIYMLPNIDFSKFLDELGKFNLISEDFYQGSKKIEKGAEQINKSMQEVFTQKFTPEGASGFTSGINSILDGIFDDFLNPEAISSAIGGVLAFIGDLLDPTNAQSAAAILGIFFSAGTLLRKGINWLIETIMGAFSAQNLSNLWTILAGALFGIVRAIGSFLWGFFNADAFIAGDGKSAGDGPGVWVIKIIAKAFGSILGMIPILLYDAISLIFSAIVGLIKIHIDVFSRGGGESKELSKAGNSYAYDFLKTAIIDPFMSSFKSDRLTAIATFVWEAIKYIFFKIVEFLLGGGEISSTERFINETIANFAANIVGAFFEVKLSIMKAMGSSAEELDAERARIKDQYTGPIKKYFDDQMVASQQWRIKTINQLRKDMNLSDEFPTPPPIFGFDANAPKPETVIPPQFSIPAAALHAQEGAVIDYVQGVRKAAENAINDPKNLPPLKIAHQWALDPPDEPIDFTEYKKYLSANVFEFPLPVIPELILPETGADLTGPLYKATDSSARIIDMLGINKVGPDISLAVNDQVVSGVTDGVQTAYEANFANKNITETSGYRQLGLPQGEAVSQGIVDGLIPGKNALKNMDKEISVISLKSLPTLSKNMDDWRLDMTTRVGPQIKTVTTGTIDPMKTAFDAVSSSVENLNNKLLILGERLNNIKTPPELTPGSPTPFELGLRGIAKATNVLNKQQLPGIFSAAPGVPDAEGRQRRVGFGGRFGQSQNINVTVKVGDKEVAGAVATAAAGEIKKMVYRDMLRG